MPPFARAALASMLVAVGLDLAACALVDQLKDSMSRMANQDGVDVPDATAGIPARETPKEQAKASTEKRKLEERQRVNVPDKRSNLPEPVAQEPVAQSRPSQPAPSQLSPWPEAPSSGRFSR